MHICWPAGKKPLKFASGIQTIGVNFSFTLQKTQTTEHPLYLE